MEFNAQQMREARLIKEGVYRFYVLDAREKRSASGNDMINLKLRLDVNGSPTTYWTSLIKIPKMFWQIEHFCESIGMPELIEQGRIMAHDCMGKEGHIEIKHKANKDTGEVEEFTKDFVLPEQTLDEVHESLDDDVPSFT